MQEIQLLEMVNQIHRRMHRRLTPLFESEGLSAIEVVVLKMMHRRPVCRVSELSERTGIPPSTLTGILDRLEAGGWLQRFPDPEDRRSILLRSAPKLSSYVERLTARVEKELQAMLGALPPENCGRLLGDLQKILDHLENDQR